MLIPHIVGYTLDSWCLWDSRGMPCTFLAPLSERMFPSWGTFLATCAGPSGVKDF